MEQTDIADISEQSEAKTPESSADSAKVPEIPEPAVQVNASVSTNANVNVSKEHVKDFTIDLGNLKKDKNKRKSDDHSGGIKKFKNNSMDKIVSPVVPQPGAWLKRSNSVVKPKHRQNKNIDGNIKMPEFKEKHKQFQYGNYNR